MELQAMKESLKHTAVRLRTIKQEIKAKQRAGIDSFHPQHNLPALKAQYRYMHIAYCEMRGTPYERIEPYVREGNEPSRVYIDAYKKKYSEEVANV